MPRLWQPSEYARYYGYNGTTPFRHSLFRLPSIVPRLNQGHIAHLQPPTPVRVPTIDQSRVGPSTEDHCH